MFSALKRKSSLNKISSSDLDNADVAPSNAKKRSSLKTSSEIDVIKFTQDSWEYNRKSALLTLLEDEK
eukprot:Awhi_evm1s2049